MVLRLINIFRPPVINDAISQEDEDLEFLTKLITFDFFFFDW